MKERQSGVELLKLIAIFIIMICHYVPIFGVPEFGEYANTSCFVDIYVPTTDISVFILRIFRGFGSLGNVIFFVCSAWFLVDNNRVSVNKICRMILDMTFFGVGTIMLYCIVGEKIGGGECDDRLYLPLFIWYMVVCHNVYNGIFFS